MHAHQPQPTPHMLAHCPLCQAAYEDASVRLLGEVASTLSARGTSRMFHLTCNKCSHAILAIILESGHGVSSIGLVTDLEVQDAVRIHNAVPLSADDVLRAHHELNLRSREWCLGLVG
jgi:hypothetical protein